MMNTGTILDYALTEQDRAKLFSTGAIGFRPPEITSPKLKPLKHIGKSTPEAVFIIQKCVSEYFDIPTSSLRVRRSSPGAGAWMRQLAMALAVEFLPHERSKRIAEQFECDRSMLSYATKAVRDIVSVHQKNKVQYQDLKRIIKGKL